MNKDQEDFDKKNALILPPKTIIPIEISKANLFQ